MISDTAIPWGQQRLPQPLPWQQAIWQQLQRSYQQNVFSHAYIISGDLGSGAEQLADSAAAALLCDGQGFTACGHCDACQLMKAGTHPDICRVGLEEGAVLKIAQIRAAIDFAFSTANRGGYRCIVIQPAEAMNVNAANALLKLLEEPGDKTAIFLVSYSMAAIPATLRSRCQQLAVSTADQSLSKQWMAEQAISPAFDQAYYHQRPLLAWSEHSAGQAPSFTVVSQAFEGLLAGTLATTKFFDALKAVDSALLIDHLISTCLNALKSEQVSPEIKWFDAIDSLVNFKRGLLNGSTINQSLFYQQWCTQLLANKSEARIWA